MRVAVLSRLSAIGILWLLCAPLALAREWTSSNGKFKIEAEFVAVKDGKVVLEKPDGSFLSVPLNQISKTDIEFIEKELGRNVDVGGAGEGKPARAGNGMDAGKSDAAKSGSESEATASEIAKPRMIKLKGSKEGDPPGVVRDFGEQGWGLKSLAFSGDGSVLVGGKSDQMVAVFDVNEGSRKNITDRLDALGAIKRSPFRAMASVCSRAVTRAS